MDVPEKVKRQYGKGRKRMRAGADEEPVQAEDEGEQAEPSSKVDADQSSKEGGSTEATETATEAEKSEGESFFTTIPSDTETGEREGGSEFTAALSGIIYSDIYEGDEQGEPMQDDDLFLSLEPSYDYDIIEEEEEAEPTWPELAVGAVTIRESLVEEIPTKKSKKKEKKKAKHKKAKTAESLTLMTTSGFDISEEEEEGEYYGQMLSSAKLKKKHKKGGKEKKSKKKKIESLIAIAPSISYNVGEEEEEEEEEEDWTWESYTPGSSKIQLLFGEKDKDKKKKKGKKKKEKKPKAEGEEAAAGEKKKKKEKKEIDERGGKKKKKIPPDVLAEMAKQAALAARQAEEEARLREQMEIDTGVAKEKKEALEQALRMEQLHMSLQTIEHIIQHNVEAVQLEREEIEWIQYQKTDGLPDPYVCKQLNSYLLMWEQYMDYTTMDEAALRTAQVLKLLEDVTGFIESPLGAEKQQIENWNWIRRLFREAQQKCLDMACYRVLRDVGKKMTAIDLENSEFEREEPNFTICLWTMVELPTPQPNPRAHHRVRTDLKFPKLNFHLILPMKINCYRLAIRVMYISYNHLSDTCSSFAEPPMPENHQLDLYEITREEWYSKMIYKYEQYVRIKEKEEEPVTPQEYDRETGVMPHVPFIKMEVTPSHFVIKQEDEKYKTIRYSLISEEVEHVINLRRYIIIGGVFFMNLYFQPPQPQHCVSMEVHISRLYVPRALKEVKFCAHYKPPQTSTLEEELSEGELEEETKKHEAQLDKLIFVSVQLPAHVMWTDTPTACMWDEQKKVWTTEDVHDYKYLEETTSVTFRTKRFGMFSFAMNRFTNFPYQTWEVKPEEDGTVTVQLVAAILILDFNVKGDMIAVKEVQNAPNDSLNGYVGHYHKLPTLKRLLLEIGIDVFPYFDAFCYVESSYEKHWQMEKHLYFQMGQVCACYNFSWSRWNAAAGRRCAVMQMREYKVGKTKQVSYSMLHVTPLKAEFIDCTEVSSEFLTEPVEGMAFYADLYTLVKGVCNIAIRSKIQYTSAPLVTTVAELLQSLRVLSFS